MLKDDLETSFQTSKFESGFSKGAWKLQRVLVDRERLLRSRVLFSLLAVSSKWLWLVHVDRERVLLV